jgi:enamine deaminase RidA (YjgF/YER057c/UK114 family)
MNSSNRQSISTGTPWEKTVAYSRAVRVGQHIFVAGTTASDQDGRTVAVGDPYWQTVYILQKIEAALKGLGSSLSDVVRTRMFLTDMDNWPEVGRAHGEAFAGINPAATLVEISRLVNPDHLIEIEVEAMISE